MLVISSFGLLWIFIYIDICFYFSWEYTWVWNCWFAWKLYGYLFEKLFSKAAALFCIPTSNVWRTEFLYVITNTCYYIKCMKYTNFKCMKWYLIVVFACISLLANDIEHFFLCLLAIVYLLWRSIYSDAFSIFKLYNLYYLVA